MTAMNITPGGVDDCDVVVVGAGFAGLYQVHRLHRAGFRVRAFEKGADVGGTWYWNRYPGARCDIESIVYSYSFDADLQREWKWPQRYAEQPGILRYLQHVKLPIKAVGALAFAALASLALMLNLFAADWRDPLTGRTLRQLAARLPG